MSSEWFYLQRWKAASQPNWVLVDRVNKKILKSGMKYYEAEHEAYKLKSSDNKIFVVNTADPLYNEIVSNQEEKNADS